MAAAISKTRAFGFRPQAKPIVNLRLVFALR